MKLPVRLGLYTIRMFILPFIVVSIFFTLLFVIQDFISIMSNSSGLLTLPFKDLMMYYILWMPKMFFMLFPIPILFSTIYVMANLNQSHELLAVHSAGISTYKFALFLIFFILLLTLILVFTQDYFVTNTYILKDKLEQSVFNRSSVKDNSNINLMGQNNRLYFVNQYVDKTMELILVHVIEYKKDSGVQREIFASNALYDKQQKKWIYYNVKEFIYSVSDDNVPKILINEYTEKLYEFEESPQLFERSIYNLELMTIRKSYQYMRLLKRYHITSFVDELKFWQKFSFPFSGLIISLFGISIGTMLRKNVLVNALLICLIVFGIYYYFINTFFILGKKGFGTAFFAAWIGNFLFFILGIASLVKEKS